MTPQRHSGPGMFDPQPASDIRAIGAVAGMIGPLLFTVGFVVQGLLRPTEYDPIAETVSALEAGPNGWIQQLNFCVFGILMVIFGAGLCQGLRTGRRWIGAGVVLWWGVGLLIAGLFPLRENLDGQTYDPTGVHQLNGAILFTSTWVGLAVLSWCLRSDPRWRGLARYTLVTSAALAVLFLVMAVLAMPSTALLHPWAGLLQRLVLAVWFPCLIVLAARLRRVSRSRSSSSVRDDWIHAI